MAGKKKTENLPLFLTPEQASKVSGIGVNRVRQLMDEGQLEYLPVGNRRLTTVKALLDYYDRAKGYPDDTDVLSSNLPLRYWQYGY